MGRIEEVDALRGIAIILMVIYHIFFDMDMLGMMEIDLFYDVGWLLFQRIIGFTFLFVVGVSLVLSERRNREGYIHHAKRAGRLAAVALLITAVTWAVMPSWFIRFGVIHMIAASTLIAPLFLRLGWINVPLGILLILGGLGTHHTDVPYLFWLGFIDKGYMALDHYPLIPWFGVVLLGIYAGQSMQWGRGTRNIGLLAAIGRRSLLIYILHQPIILALLLAMLYLS